MKIRKKSLTKQLTLTVIVLNTAMLAVWVFFYIGIRDILQGYVLQNMEQVSQQVITEAERSFLQFEEVSLALSSNENVSEFLSKTNVEEMTDAAGNIEITVKKLVEGIRIIDNCIIYNTDGLYYRFLGNLGNTDIKSLIHIITRDGLDKQVRFRLGSNNFIGYVSHIYNDSGLAGTIVLFTEDDSIYRIFEQMSVNKDINLALAADSHIVLSQNPDYIDMSVDRVKDIEDYVLFKQVGFTSFELIVSYEDSNRNVNLLFIVFLLLMTGILFLLLKFFLDFWKNKFFNPIQKVINEVEAFEGGKGEELNPTGLEHFDGLVRGINAMVTRIEQKEQEIFEASYSLQEAELKKQKALIVSLKKQISAHFTVNVLTVIKALAANGENEKAGTLCDGLSFLLRYANAGDSYINGMNEFSVLEKYATIMELRYPNKFSIDIDFNDDLEKIKIPRMLLQPVVENSIVHGIVNKKLSGPGLITVSVEISDEYAEFIVKDNGCGMDDEQLEALRKSLQIVDSDDVEVEGLSHVALINIQRRIVSYYGNGYGLSVNSEPDKGTEVRIKLPLDTKFQSLN